MRLTLETWRYDLLWSVDHAWLILATLTQVKSCQVLVYMPPLCSLFTRCASFIFTRLYPSPTPKSNFQAFFGNVLSDYDSVICVPKYKSKHIKTVVVGKGFYFQADLTLPVLNWDMLSIMLCSRWFLVTSWYLPTKIVPQFNNWKFFLTIWIKFTFLSCEKEEHYLYNFQ